MASMCDAELLLLHVAFSPLPLVLSAVGPVPVSNEFAGSEESGYLNRVLSGIPANVQARAAVGSGMRPGEAILEEAARERVDLIAMATHGRSGWARVAYGSIAEHVLRHTNTAMLMKRVDAVRPANLTDSREPETSTSMVSGKSRHDYDVA